jgi:small-conductance mechanosensitive channel
MGVSRRLARALSLCILLVSLPDPAASAGEAAIPPTHDLEREADETAPVVFDGRALFPVRGVSARPAGERARAISERILGIARDRSLSAEAVTTVSSDGFVEVVAGPTLVATVSDADAALERVDRLVLAKALAERVRGAIEAYRRERSGPALARGAAKSLGALGALWVVLWLLGISFHRLEALLDRRYGGRMRSHQMHSLPFVQAEQLWAALQRILRVLRSVLAVAAIIVCLEVVLGSFPWSRPIAQGMLSYVTEPLRTIGSSVLRYVPKLIFLIILGTATRWGLRLLKLFFSGIEGGTIVFSGFYPEWALPTYRLVRIFVLAFILVVAYPYLPGSESAAFKGVSLFLGVMLSLGSSSAISNLIAGYSMTYRRAFRIGDRVRIGDHTGDVENTRLLVTHLRTVKNEEVVIPNSLILNSSIVNFSSVARAEGLILHTTVGIGYEVPWRQVEAMLLAAAERTPGLRPEPKPFVLQQSLGDFAVNYELNVYTDEPREMLRTYTELHRNIQDVFNEHEVQIMTPAYRNDPEQPKIVPKDRWYEPPARKPGTQGDSWNQEAPRGDR